MGINYARVALQVKKAVALVGQPATLEHLPSGATDSVTITPIVEETISVEGRVVEVFSTTIIAATDPGLTSEPKPGDLLTADGRQYRIPVDRGHKTVRTPAGMFHKLRMKQAGA